MIVAALAGLFAFTSQAAAKPQPGDPDSSFGKNGVAITSISPGQSYGHAVAIGNKGRIVVAGDNRQKAFAVARYKPNGKHDHSFSHDGSLTTTFPGAQATLAWDVDVGHKGAVVVAGQECPSPVRCKFAVAKYRSDGHLDSSFGNGGRATVSFPGNQTSFARGVAFTSNGQVLVGGTACPHRAGSGCDFALTRLNKHGQVDPRFGNNGYVITQFTDSNGDPVDSSASGMALNSRGRIILGGAADGVALACYKPKGRPVTSFGHDGKVDKQLPRAYGDVQAIAVDKKDKILVAGSQYSLARFGKGGGLNQSFGNGGQVNTHVSDAHSKLYAMAIDSRNRIVVAGSPHFTVVRYQDSGELNKSFGRKGIARANFGSGWPYALAIDSHDRPVPSGFLKPKGSALRAFAVARFLG